MPGPVVRQPPMARPRHWSANLHGPEGPPLMSGRHHRQGSGRRTTPLSTLLGRGHLNNRRGRNHQNRAERISAVGRATYAQPDRSPGPGPPEPPLVPTPAMATDPDTPPEVLWSIARNHPELRRWLAANPAATPALLETVSQLGGPGVKRSLDILLGNS